MSREIRVVCSLCQRRYLRAAFPLPMALPHESAAHSFFVALTINIQRHVYTTLPACVTRQFIQFFITARIRATYQHSLPCLTYLALIEDILMPIFAFCTKEVANIGGLQERGW